VATGLNPPELPTSDEARIDAHIASTCVELHQRTQSCHIKKRNGKLMMREKLS